MKSLQTKNAFNNYIIHDQSNYVLDLLCFWSSNIWKP